eukprot:scaffold326187_cov29-Attheya_sp.AAC.1
MSFQNRSIPSRSKTVTDRTRTTRGTPAGRNETHSVSGEFESNATQQPFVSLQKTLPHFLRSELLPVQAIK